ncbi:hypothetical protein DL93DRAFT_1990231 [Clavulina sp. PMI_390]|nr:hypothetical protein DL93DRAFT_1990231 [Clavulina sp. PMI_390]
MPHLPKSLHLEYNLTKPLRASYSILGILTLTCAMIGVIIGTLLTKGLVAAQDVEYLTNPQEPGYSCNSTLVYPGQLFGSFALNTSFQYQAVSQFAYRGQSLTNCTVANLTYIDVIGPPLNYPSITVNQSGELLRLILLICHISLLNASPFLLRSILYVRKPPQGWKCHCSIGC